MLTQQHTQEGLSRSFVQALAASAGVNLHAGFWFDYGFDGSFRPIVMRGKRRVESGFPIDFQLKCTTAWKHEGEDVAYNVETKTYNDLVTRDPNGIGAYLLLVCIPKNKEEWI